MDFFNAYDQGFARVAACTAPVAVADPATNVRTVLEQARASHDAVRDAVTTLVEGSRDLLPILLVGAPLEVGNRVLNCALVVHRGRILGIAPKSYLPTYREFYERRHFAPGDDRRGESITLAGQRVPFGPDLLFDVTDVPGLVLHVEVCEDMWVPVPPSAEAALAGATVLANLSGSPITIARADDRRLLVRSASQRLSAVSARWLTGTMRAWPPFPVTVRNGASRGTAESGSETSSVARSPEP